jgi:hypothetical protein
LESAGQVIQVDSGLCQPAGTPIFVQTGRRLGVTFVVDVEADVLRPIHVSVERRITRLADVQTTFNTLILVFPTAHATRLARVTFRHFNDLDALDFGLVFEDIGEAVERPVVQVEVAVPTPVLRVAVLVFTDTSEFPDVDTPNLLLNTPLYDVFSEAVEEVGAAFRPLLVQSSGPFTTRVIALGDFFREVVTVLLQAVSGVQVGVLGTVRDCREVADSEVDTR